MVYPFSIAAESREPVSESGILVSKAVDLTIDEVTLKPAGQSWFLRRNINKKTHWLFIRVLPLSVLWFVL